MNLRNIQNGAVAGIAGGIVFGIMMGMMGVLPMIGQMAGLPNAFAGFLIHLVISALIGGSFAVLFQAFAKTPGTGLGYGLVYDAIWWVLGPLTLMPFMMGMGLGTNWNTAAATAMFPAWPGA